MSIVREIDRQQLRDSKKLLKANRKATFARRNWRKVRQEFWKWSELAQHFGGEDIITFRLVRQRYREALQRMRAADSELESLQYTIKEPRR